MAVGIHARPRARPELETLDTIVPPWKARCYGFRTFHRAGKRRQERGVTYKILVFDGPLLGDPDRQHGSAARSPMGATTRETIDSPTI
jgi:hypothetical protein